MTPIVFKAAVYKVQTLVDGGLRITLDLPETAIIQAAQLMECKREEKALTITIMVDEPFRQKVNDNGHRTRRPRQIQEG
jgi:hypothetical protein